MTTIELTQEFTDTRDRLVKLREEFDAIAKAEFLRCTAVIFEKFPTLEAISWVQYAPYFNDGDPCRFYVREYSAQAIFPEGSVYYEEYDSESSESISDDRGAVEYVAALLEIFPDDMFESLFGNDAKVTIYRDGDTKTSYYEHN